MILMYVVVFIICMQEMYSGNSTDQRLVQQTSEIMLLKAELETLRKEHEQLTDIHSKCEGQRNISDDQVRINVVHSLLEHEQVSFNNI